MGPAVWTAAAVLGALLSRAGAEGPPPVKAWTQGDFTLRYQLAKDGDGFRARGVRVLVRNRTHYAAAPTPKLVHHEAVHRRINQLGAREIQARLADYQAGRAFTLLQADRAFRSEFRRRLREVEELHRAWDATHKIFEAGLAEPAETFYP